MGIMLAEPGYHTRCFVEWEEYPRRVLITAQRAGYFAPAPIWDDLRSFDARPFRGAFDIVLAGYPCQPFSTAGQRRGADDPRHLWPEVARIIRECRPEWVFLENVAGHIDLGAETVLRELWEMGFTPAAGAFSAAEVGAPHERLRWFCVAHRDSDREALANYRWSAVRETEKPYPGRCCNTVADADSNRCERHEQSTTRLQGQWPEPHGPIGEFCRIRIFPPGPRDAKAWAETLAIAPTMAPAASVHNCFTWLCNLATADAQSETAAAESAIHRMAHGLAVRARALRLLGNGVHPLAAAHAWRSLAAALGLGPVDLETADDCD
jgi:DNA (cytosine-5)-methyltransferase 1